MHQPTHAMISDTTATAVLKLAVVANQRSIDRMLDLLAASSSGSLDVFGSLVRSGQLPPGATHPEALSSSSPGLACLNELKDRGKALAASALGEVDRMRGTALYMLAVGAALAHHGQCISSADTKELRSLLLELAELTTPLWSELFQRAAGACPVPFEADPRGPEDE